MIRLIGVMSTSKKTPPPTMAAADPQEMADKLLREAMEGVGSDDEALKKAFNILSSQMKGYVSADVIQRAMPILCECVEDRKEIDEVIKNKANVENDTKINYQEFIRIIRNIWKRVADSMINEEIDSDEGLETAFMVLAKKNESYISAALLRRIIPFLGGNLNDKVIFDDIKKVKSNADEDGKINYEQFIQIIRNIWQMPTDLLLKKMQKGADSADALVNAFNVLSNPLDGSVSATILRVVLLNLDKNLNSKDVDWIIHYVKAKLEGELIQMKGLTEIVSYVKDLMEKYPLDKIYGVLTREKTRKVVIFGESGVGKTWMATKTADRATRKGKFDFALWVNLKGMDLSKIIGYQLSLLSASDDMEAEDAKEVSGRDKKFKSLKEKIHEALEKKSVLLIFDAVNSIEEINKVLSEKSELDQLLNLSKLNHYKVLITTSDFYELQQEFKREWIGIEVKRWTSDESTSFLRNMITAGKYSEVEKLAEFYIKRSKGLPGEILIIAKTLNYFVSSDEGLQKLQGVKKVVLEDTAHDYDDYHNIEKLLISTEMVPKIILVDCYSSETPAEHFLNKRGWVHYNELISYWIIEGHLGHFSCIEDAYAQGHHVLMELLDCGLLKTLKAGYVKSNGATFEFSAQDYFDLYQNNRLGLATTFDNKLGNTVLGDGMIRTFPRDKEREKKEKMSTLLLDGDRTGEVSDNLFDSMIDLEILAIFNPTHKPFPLPISYMSKYRLLVLRGCEFLESFDKVFKMIGPEAPEISGLGSKAFSNLTVLEISGPSSLKKIPENLFDTMTNLKSLNMSSLQMEFLPPSFYDLRTIEILILKDCSSLKRMESLKKFERLQLLDLSGATSLEAFKDKSFKENRKLQMINLSQSRIAKFPVVHSLENLQYLSLSKCPALVRVRKIGLVETLRVFDISGSKNVEQLLDPGLKNLKNLFTLDVSGTAIRRLPSTIGTPRYLHLRDCSNLKQLPPIETLSEVRVLDLSGSAFLDDVKRDFITTLKNLTEFNLSKTGVVNLPPLSSLVNLRRLLMSQCQSLKKLEGLGSLINLEVLDLSGCKALSKIEDQSFDKMDRLHSLDLSETPLDMLPSLSNLEKLKRLNLRGCTKLTNIPGFEDLPVLEDLDISRTTLKVPKFENLDCRHGPKPSSFKIFKATEIVEDLGAQPVSNCDDTKKLPQEKMDQCDHWNISNRLASQNSETIGKPVIDAHFLQLLEMHSTLLEDNIKKFHFFVYPMEEATEQPIDKKLPIKEFVLRKILLGNVFPEAQDRCLEIRGFRDFPKFLEQLLEHAEMMVLIKNSCIQFLSDLGAGNLKKMKVCWIERCNEMEYVTDEVKESADIPTENIEILWVSEAAKLKSICKETSRGIGFSALTSLYLEYCPELSSLSFSNEQLSGLKILHVKYCQKLVKLFEVQFPNLKSLHLWALPALKEISCSMQSLRTLTVAHCPLLLYIFDRDTSSPTNLEGLQLKVKFCDNMKSIFQDGKLPSGLLRENIIILGCPELQLPESSAPRNT
ncbi:putative disease resistance protein At4g19050 isoform X1 [Primulina tabacum]|uniref:putative disease resistance protein At4g19050 isoform X1 n=2 Tax=Primulina tabacum TaxID=48773 RepID=UPI003F5913F1